MKTAISLPDPVFDAAEKLAERLHVSRSELYAKAVLAFIRAHSEANVTEKLDEVYGQADSSLDPALARAQTKVLRREKWKR